MKRLPSALALALLTSSIVIASASAASAAAAVAPLPADDTFYAIPCNTPDLGLKLLNPLDSSWVAVGTQTTVGTVECAYQPAFDPTSGESYFIGGNTPSSEWPLVHIDTTTGDYTIVHEIWDGTTNLPIAFFGPNFPGNMLITNTGGAYFIGGTKLYPLNLGSAVLGPQIGPDLVVAGDIYATACSPVAAVCYILTEGGSLYTLDPATGAVSATLGSIPARGNYSLQVASDGTLWSSSNGGHVASFSAADPAGSYDEGARTPKYSGAYLITIPVAALAPVPVPVPALASTGMESAVPVVAAGALLALGGILALVSRRRRSRPAAS